MTNHKSSIVNRKSLVIGWLYPELMNVYGDRGNIITLTKRSVWRNIKVEIKHLDVGFSDKELSNCDLILMGGAQDKQQEIVNQDIKKHKKTLVKMADAGVPGLFICGGFQFLGNYYRDAENQIIDGLGIFDMYTDGSGNNKRLIGNVAIKPFNDKLTVPIVGFENHGGRTMLAETQKPFGKILKGHGNNESGVEGAQFKNFFGTYLHGPILPKNPQLTDFLLSIALKTDNLPTLDDSLEQVAYSAIANTLKIEI